MRILGVDFGQRRIGLALSDATATLARPWKTVEAAGAPGRSADAVSAELAQLALEDDSDGARVVEIVVGIPRRLNGDDNEQTQPARAFAEALGRAAGLPVRLQDERLTSHEADERLAARERDWRRRKAKLDAVAAAIILQDFLDERPRREPPGDAPEPGR